MHAQYQRPVTEDEGNEEEHVARAQVKFEGGQTLAQMWHQLKQMVPTARHVKALRAVTKGQREKLPFIRLPVGSATPLKIEEKVLEWDLERQYHEGKRVKETQQLAWPKITQAQRQTVATQPKQITR